MCWRGRPDARPFICLDKWLQEYKGFVLAASPLCRRSTFGPREREAPDQLGRFGTAEEAALAFARALGLEGSARAAARELETSMSSAQAIAVARTEGLVLESKHSNNSGFLNVAYRPEHNHSRPFEAARYIDGRRESLGSYSCAEAAALQVARHSTRKQARRIFEVGANKSAKVSKEEAKAHAKAVAADAKAAAKAVAADAKAAAKAARAAAKVEAKKQESEAKIEAKRQEAARKQHVVEQRKAQQKQAAMMQRQLLREAALRQASQRQQANVQHQAPSASSELPSSFEADLADLPADVLLRQALDFRAYPFRCLGLRDGAEQETVRKRYLSLALRLHPDKLPHPAAAEAFAAVEAAYKTLCGQA